MSVDFAPSVRTEETTPDTDTVIAMLVNCLVDGADHPELWEAFPALLAQYPDLADTLAQRVAAAGPDAEGLIIFHALSLAALGDIDAGLAAIGPLAVHYSQSALAQGALFHLRGLADPENPRYRLAGKICRAPFEQLDVLERSTHQCCASWLHVSAGDLNATPWEQVWNSPSAQAVRASVLDGSYRYCNKSACPTIQANGLVPEQDFAARSPFWADVIANRRTVLDRGPKVVNLAYDRTCNLACPSCRTERYAADDAARVRFDTLQEEEILPMLKHAEVVFVTGSGDPFVSKNFRRLLKSLNAQDYPDLRVQIMTNGMLFNARQWDEFPALHGRIAVLKISIDAATGPTHEKLRLGSHWPTMLDNMRFAGELTAQGLIENFELVFTAQQANFREMGDAVDLAKNLGATGIYFARMTNWSTFSPAAYAAHAVFVPTHPEYGEFIAAMRDPRLYDPIVMLGDLTEFAPEGAPQTRFFAH